MNLSDKMNDIIWKQQIYEYGYKLQLKLTVMTIPNGLRKLVNLITECLVNE